MTPWEVVSKAISDHNAVTFTKELDHDGMREYVGQSRKAVDHSRKVTVATVQHVRRGAGVGLMLGAIIQQYSSDSVFEGVVISR